MKNSYDDEVLMVIFYYYFGFRVILNYLQDRLLFPTPIEILNAYFKKGLE